VSPIVESQWERDAPDKELYLVWYIDGVRVTEREVRNWYHRTTGQYLDMLRKYASDLFAQYHTGWRKPDVIPGYITAKRLETGVAK
jgi:hypothetical protein